MYSRYSNEFKQNPRDKKKLGKKIPKENTKIGNLDFLKRKKQIDQNYEKIESP